MVETKHERFKFKNKQEFLKKIQEQNLDIPFSDDIRILFDRTVIQEETLPNRFAVHPMEGADGNAEGTPGDLTFRRYLRFEAGGTGLIWFEATAVSKGGRSNARQLMLAKKNQDAFKRLTEETRKAGKKGIAVHHDILLILQLTHSGRYSNPKASQSQSSLAAALCSTGCKTSPKIILLSKMMSWIGFKKILFSRLNLRGKLGLMVWILRRATDASSLSSWLHSPANIADTVVLSKTEAVFSLRRREKLRIVSPE